MKNRKSTQPRHVEQNRGSSANREFFLSEEILAKLPKGPITIDPMDFIRMVSSTPPAANQAAAKPQGATIAPGPWKYKGNGTIVTKQGSDLLGTFHNAQKAGRKGIDNRNLVITAPELAEFAQKVAENFPHPEDTLGKEARVLLEKIQP